MILVACPGSTGDLRRVVPSTRRQTIFLDLAARPLTARHCAATAQRPNLDAVALDKIMASKKDVLLALTLSSGGKPGRAGPQGASAAEDRKRRGRSDPSLARSWTSATDLALCR